jgi:MRG-binding protein
MDTDPTTPIQPIQSKPQENGNASDSEESISFLDSVPGEISLFRAVTRARPIGMHRHFHMMSILHQMFRETGQMVNGDDIWTKLKGMYDLDTLNDLVSPSVSATDAVL